MTDLGHPDDLVTLVAKPSEFEAHALVAVLREAGIEAFAFGAMRAALPFSERLTPVPVQVRQVDLERAQAALKQNVADSMDLDWDDVDVGERLDDLPLKRSEGMRGFLSAGFFLAIFAIVCLVLLAIYLILGP